MTYDYDKCPQGIKKITEKEFNISLYFLENHLERYLNERNERIKILEIGCGGGRNLFILKEKYNRLDIFGTDISKTAIEFAKKTNLGRFEVSDSKIIPFEMKFDIIIFIDILEHLNSIEDAKETLKVAEKHLLPSGFIYITVPIELNRFNLTWFFRKLPFFKNLTKMFYGHSLQFDIKSFLGLIDLNKLELKEVFYSVHFLSQLQVLFFFFLPKILLRFFFGEKIAIELRDSNEIINDRKHPLLNILKRVFVSLSRPLSYLAFKESNLRKNSSFAAGNMHLLISKNPFN